MRIGRLRHTVRVQERSGAKDGRGRLLDEFNDLFPIRADVSIISSDKLLASGKDMNVEIATVLARYDSRVKHKQFFVHNSHRYEVVGIKPTNNSREMIVTIEREIR